MTYISQSAGYSFPAYYEIRPRAIVSRTCPVQDAFYSAGNAIRKTAASKPGLLKIGLLAGITYFFGKKLLNAVQQRWGEPSDVDEPPKSQQGSSLLKPIALASLGLWGVNKLSRRPISSSRTGAVRWLRPNRLLTVALLECGVVGLLGILLLQKLRASRPATTSPISPQPFFAYADALIQQQSAIAKQRFELQVFRAHKAPDSSAYSLMSERLAALDAADETLRQKLAALAMAL